MEYLWLLKIRPLRGLSRRETILATAINDGGDTVVELAAFGWQRWLWSFDMNMKDATPEVLRMPLI